MSQQVSRLDPLFAPRGIAVIGASRDPGKLGAVMLRSLRPFGGPVAGVNPRDADPGARRYASVAEAAAATHARLDLAVLARLGALLAANPAIEEIEINPLRITGEGLLALDAVLRTADD
jgi:CoA binding domain/ATP-grasp domain